MGLPQIRGRAAFIFDEPNFDIDQIIGVENIKVTDMETLMKVSMQRYDRNFIDDVRPGDVLVGGENFGYGHPHYPPMRLMRHLGISAVIADSFAPTYWSIEIAAGFPQIACPEIHRSVRRWDELQIDWEASRILNRTTGANMPFEPLSQRDHSVLEAGGIVSYLKGIASAK
ncbi:3-isopropylmalate dehydratase [Burkholderia pseudomallei]|nr:3-isopropylmalate dehydratase [Burkholderia pseudomallei]